MASHWEDASDWEQSTSEREEDPQQTLPLSAGTYHCKSALRTHDSNMRLYLYKKAYLAMQNVTGSCPYTEECCLLLPDLWGCFYRKTYGLNRVQCTTTSRAHSFPSSAFSRWADYTLTEVLSGNMVSNSLLCERDIWGTRISWVHNFPDAIYQPVMNDMRRVMYLTYFLNLTLVVMNHKPSPARPDITVDLPGICSRVEEGITKVSYNEYLHVTVSDGAVHISTPIFNQILQKDIYLNLCDKINERMNVTLGARVISRINTQGDLESNVDPLLPQHVDKVILWGDIVLYRHGNRAYDMIGKYEAYCVSSILLHDNPHIWNNREFQDNLLQDDLKNEPHLYPSAVELCNLLNGLSAATISELHGLWRLWGHPIIDLEGGMKKMEATCLKQRNVDKRETLIGVRTFKLTFARNYFKKHHHYPLNNCSDPSNIRLYQEHLSESDTSLLESMGHRYSERSYVHSCLRKETEIWDRQAGYRHEDWDDVEFVQNFQIPQSLNLATMIKDKAISQTRSELVSSVITRNSVFDSTKRRGVLKWLSEQTLRLRDFLGLIDKDGIPDDDSIIGLYPKERELKTKARFFSLMSYKMRMYITATEEILGKYLLPYFPMITMSDTLLNMIIRLYNMTTRIGATQSQVTYSMNIDFSKWNQNMRERTNAGIFQNIDRIIGFRQLISRTHDIFRRSYLYLCSGEYIPSIVQGTLTSMSPYSRIGDESGKEGLRQKGWTITTVCDILSLAFTHNVAIELIGGGDNQVLTVTIKNYGKERSLGEEEQMLRIKERMIRFRNALAKKMEKRALPLKLEETWISHRLLMYNKIMYLDGVPLPGRLKVISRMFCNSNEGIISIGSICSTLGTGFQSLSSKDYDPLLAWVISRWLTLVGVAQYYLMNPMAGTIRLDKVILSSRERMKKREDPFGGYTMAAQNSALKRKQNFTGERTLSLLELYCACIYYHKVLGGPGIGTPYAYIMKGFPDPLSEALTFNYHVINKACCPSLKAIVTNFTKIERSNVQHWEHLLEDPVSVNHNAPSHGVAALREQASKVLRITDIRNRRFKELITLGDKEYLRDLSAALCSTPSIEPRLLHDIVGSTIPGYVNTILSKVDQSSTLSKLANNVDVVAEIYRNEIMYYIHLSDKAKIAKGHQIGACPTQDARMLRNTTWAREVVGVTTPHPAAYLEMVRHTSNDHSCDQNYISVLIKRSTPACETLRGPFRPYFGSYTAEKFKTGVLASAYGDEDLLKRALKIQKLLGWRYKEGTNMYKLIQGILGCVTDSDPSKFLPTIEEITGDVEHRYHDMATKHGGIPSNLIKYYTYSSCNTSTFVNHSKGAANETLHFQAAMIYCSLSGILATLNRRVVTEMIHFHEKCLDCIQEIRHVEGSGEDLRGIDLMSCPGNDLMFVNEADIPIHYHNLVSFNKSQEKADSTDLRATPKEEFTEEKERSSWILLCTASLILGSKMKRSAVVLVLSRMSKEELIYVLLCIIRAHLIKRGRPTSLYNLCDIMDCTEEYGDLIKDIMGHTTILNHLTEMGTMPSSDAPHDLSAINELMRTDMTFIDNMMANAVCKYQDPEFSLSRTLIICAKNPVVKTCIVCAESVRDLSRSRECRDCSIHGALDTRMRYHLYSLDKLSRYAGPPLTSETNTGKRKITELFSSAKAMRPSVGDKVVRTRLSGFLYKRVRFEATLLSYLLGECRSMNITGGEDAAYDKLSTSACYTPPRPEDDGIPSSISDALGLSQCILAGLSLQDEVEGDIFISLELIPSFYSMSVYRKAIIMVSDALQMIEGATYILMLYVESISNLEESGLQYIEELVKTIRDGLNKSYKLRVLSLGDQHLDTERIVSTASVNFLTSPSSILYSTKHCKNYMITSCDSVYNDMRRLEDMKEKTKKEWRVKIILPRKSISWPYPILAEITPSEEKTTILDSHIRLALEELGPARCTEIGDSLMEECSGGSADGLLYDLYHSLVTIKVGVISAATYETVIKSLSNGLREFSLKSNRGDSIPWRCSEIIRMIVAIKVLTSIDQDGDLRYYSKIVGVSFKVGTYKRILLHKKDPDPFYRGSLVNWTKGTFGSKLEQTTRCLSKWLVTSYKTDHPRRLFIDI